MSLTSSLSLDSDSHPQPLLWSWRWSPPCGYMEVLLLLSRWSWAFGTSRETHLGCHIGSCVFLTYWGDKAGQIDDVSLCFAQVRQCILPRGNKKRFKNQTKKNQSFCISKETRVLCCLRCYLGSKEVADEVQIKQVSKLLCSGFICGLVRGVWCVI